MPHSVLGLTPLVLAVWCLACEASFVDLRPDRGEVAAFPPDLGPPEDAGVSEDASARSTEAGVDAAEPAAGPEEVSRGTWAGRSDYAATGTVRLVLTPSGQHRLELGADFSVSGVPGPVVVLSRRDTLGTRLDPSQDVELGALSSNRGGQSYAVPAGADDRMWAWIFCKPFGVEVARARLEEVR